VIYVYLAHTGGEVVFPEGAAVVESEDDPSVRIVDTTGRILAVFSKADLSLYADKPLSKDAALD
jgi:hypothetical protein